MQQSEAYCLFHGSAVRRGELPLPIRTSSLSRPKQGFQPPRPVGVSNYKKPLERDHSDTTIHSQTPRPPKAGFKGLFNRTRSDKALDAGVSVDIPEHQTDDFQSIVTKDTPTSSNTEAAVVSVERAIMKPFPATPKTPFPQQPRTCHNEEPLPASAAVWATRSFCRAYPQAVKSATLLAPKLSAAGTIRHDGVQRNPSKGYRHKQTNPKSEFLDNGDSSERIHKTHTKRTADYTLIQDWTRKIYILTTSGYLLQYATEGDSKRLPEKTMLLQKESVAFASDAIPGKHWVLQISQTSDLEGNIFADAPRSIFGKLGPREQIEETPNSFLLVLNSPEEMDSWLMTIRNEIQALGKTNIQPGLQCYHPIIDDSQKLPKRSNGRDQIKENAEQVYTALARVPPSKTSLAEVAKADCRTMRMDDPRTTEPRNGPSFTSRQSLNLQKTPSFFKSTDSAVCGRIRTSSTASNTSAGSTTLIPSADSSTANLPVASAFTSSGASMSFGHHTSSLVHDKRTIQQSLLQAFSNGQRNSEVWPARPRQQSGYSQEASGFGDRFSAAPSCCISDIRKPPASAVIPPLSLLPTPPASATHFGGPFLVPTAARKGDFPNDTSLLGVELLVSSGQINVAGTRTCGRHSPKLHGAKCCLSNLPAPNPPLSPYALTSFDLYGSSHTRPPSNPVKPDLAIPRRTSSLRHSRKFLSQPATKSSSSPSPSNLPMSPPLARSTQQPFQKPPPTSGHSIHASRATRPYPFSAESDPAVPRRYSSIGHPRTSSPQHPSCQTASPVPAISRACAALVPRKDNVQQRQHERQWFTNAHSEHDHEPADLTVMQANMAGSYPPSEQERRKIMNRTSASQIPSRPFLGPPICPPPSCPLPSIPCVGLSHSEGSLRNRDAAMMRGVLGGDDGFRDARGEVLVWGC